MTLDELLHFLRLRVLLCNMGIVKCYVSRLGKRYQYLVKSDKGGRFVEVKEAGQISELENGCGWSQTTDSNAQNLFTTCDDPWKVGFDA